jgi:Family of unknown function (DUF6186)
MNSRDLTIIGYLSVLVAGVALQVAALRMPERLPSLGPVLTHVMRTRTGRVGILVARGWLGLHFFAK